MTADEYQQLKENILKDGCRDALVIWSDTIIDGHNRYQICTENGIEFKLIEMQFTDKCFYRVNYSESYRTCLSIK